MNETAVQAECEEKTSQKIKEDYHHQFDLCNFVSNHILLSFAQPGQYS